MGTKQRFRRLAFPDTLVRRDNLNEVLSAIEQQFGLEPISVPAPRLQIIAFHLMKFIPLN